MYTYRVAYRDPLHPSHGFHFLMCVLSLGLWLPIWVAVTVVYAFARAGRVIAQERAAYRQDDVFWAQAERQMRPSLHRPEFDAYYATQPFTRPSGSVWD
jgi:hypothetical protein